MALLASTVMDEAASVYLNDSAKLRWGYTVLLPYLRSALTELQSELEANDLEPIQEIAAIITLPPNTTDVPLPSDFVLPISLSERAVGEARFTRMDERDWEPDADRTDRLKVWVFREGKIQTLGATTTRELRLAYVRSLSAIGDATSAIEVGNALGFLAARTAGLASTFGGRATERGIEANQRADKFLSKIISTISKRTQNRPVRRRRYPWRRR